MDMALREVITSCEMYKALWTIMLGSDIERIREALIGHKMADHVQNDIFLSMLPLIGIVKILHQSLGEFPVQGSLPTRMALASRNVDVETLCPFCAQYDKTAVHVLVSCPISNRVWQVAAFLFAADSSLQFWQWWNNIVAARSKEVVEFIAAILWKIWSSRNESVWNEHSQPAWQVVNGAANVLAEWRSVCSITYVATSPPSRSLDKWCAPALSK